MIRVTVWNENIHEKKIPQMATLHPEGIHGTIKAILEEDADLTIRTATLDEPECGLTEEVLRETDVLFWWSHCAPDEVPDEVVSRIYRHVLCGMGLVALHSSHLSKIFCRLIGMPGTLHWHGNAKERLFTVKPSHPIAAGIPPFFEIGEEECYSEPFNIPEPDELVFIGWYKSGEVFRSGCCFYRGNGRIFYFQPGHETNDAFRVPEVKQILRNAAHWSGSGYRIEKIPTERRLELENE